MSRIAIPSARVLPLTIGGLAVLLAVKAGTIVTVLVPGGPDASTLAPSPVVGAALAAGHGGGEEKPKHGEKPPASAGHGDKAPAAASGHGAAKQSAAPAEPAPPLPPPEPAVSEAERALLLDLRQRRQALDAREAALGTREQVLGAAEKRLADRVTELQSLQGRLEEMEAARRTRDEANWRGLVKLYESMKPREAAAIMNDLDQPVLLEVFDRMKEAKAAAVLAAMQPERARQVTADLARLRTRANTPSGG